MSALRDVSLKALFLTKESCSLVALTPPTELPLARGLRRRDAGRADEQPHEEAVGHEDAHAVHGARGVFPVQKQSRSTARKNKDPQQGRSCALQRAR